MNILFLLKTLDTGGLEVVTSVLANEFIAKGHTVCVFSFLGGKNSIAKRFDKQVKLYERNDYSVSKENVSELRNVLIENRIDVIINQWGLPLIPIKTAKKAAKGLDIKIISVYHNAPSFNGRTQKMNIALTACENPLKRLFLKSVRHAYKTITSKAMKYIYRKSDLFMILSPCYIEEFKKFTGIMDTSRLIVMTNPVTIEHKHFQYNPNNKEREIIYVGRLDFVQKRVYRVIDTWNYLEERFPDWKLTIVGDGEDRMNLENHVNAMGLKHVSFEGFKNPSKYYKRASMLLLTSDFEGFPLVLVECMSFGVVPAVYASYAAVYDIIDDGKDGIVLESDINKGYDAERMADKMAQIMMTDDLKHRMATKAIEKSKNYSIDKIYHSWIKIIDKLIKK